MTVHEKIAVSFIGVSWVICAGILLLPFLHIEHDKLVVAAVIYLVSQLIFWTGCALAGREVMRRFQINADIIKWMARKIQKEDKGEKGA
jgi:hypothetical protein